MSEWTVNDEMTAALMNQKCVYVGSGAPDVAYEGQFWMDISTNPPIMKVYDTTNTAWLSMMPVYYETQADAWADPSQTPVRNGTIVVVYNSTQAGTRIYVYSNSAWVNISTAVSPGNFRETLITALTSAASDVTYSSNDSVADYQFYKALTIDVGVILTVTGNPGVLVCNSLTNNGTITKSATGGAGGAKGAFGAGDGGAGGGTLIIICRDLLDNNGTIQANGVDGGDATTVSEFSDGDAGGNNIALRYSTHTFGAGGAGGGVGFGAGTGGGGEGGGYSTSEGGAGGDVTYQTIQSGGSVDASMLIAGKESQAGADYFGGGGGGGAAFSGDCAGGGGGGGGGCVYISCGTLDNTGGTISANAGNGGNGGTEGDEDGGGGGGGGGLVYYLYETLTAAGTVEATLGTGGAGDNPGSNGNAGTVTGADVM